MQFADLINSNDFIDVVLQNADRARFQQFACVRIPVGNIAQPAYPSDVPRFILPGMSRSRIPVAALRMSSLLRRFRIDILHTHHYDQAVIGWLATMLNPGTRFVVGRHYSDSIYLLSRGLRKSLLLGIEHCVNSAADCIIVPSWRILQLLTDQGVDPDKVKVVHYALSPEKWRAAEQTNCASLRAELGMTGLTFGNFSRMHIEKGHTYLLKAIAKARLQVPDLRVFLVGDGPIRQDIEEEIVGLSLQDNVRLLGWRSDALRIMAAVDVVLHPTLQEAFSQTMIEALYLSKPLVITDVSGAVDVIENGVNGIMIPVRDPDALADAMLRLARDPSLRRRLGEAGRRYVEENLSIEKIVPKLEQIYCGLAGQP